MERLLGMNLMRGVVFGLALLALACGGKESVASKSAAAYDEAKAKGVAVGGGHEHGGHEAGAATETGHAAHTSATDAHAGHDMTAGSTAMDHSAHGTTGAVDHAAMGHGTSGGAAMDHSAYGAPGAVDHAAMGHGTAANAHAGHGTARGAATDHAAHRSGGNAADHAAMGHGASTSARNAHAQHGTATATTGAHAGHGTTAQAGAHDQHAGMQHAAPAAGADPHAQHRQATSSAAATDHSQHGATAPATADPHAQHRTGATAATPIAATAPRSNAEIRGMQPSATLQPDAFDAPATVSVNEAVKARQGGGHEGHNMRGITPGEDRENPPSPMPATRDRGATAGTDHSQHGGTQTQPAAAGTVYTCPMHPEVTSDKPGTCPKCGMTLVKKN
jgi:hypothetical protein